MIPCCHHSCCCVMHTPCAPSHNMLGVGLCSTADGSSSVSGSREASQLLKPASTLPCSNLPDCLPVESSVAQRTYERNCCSEENVLTSRRGTSFFVPYKNCIVAPN